MNRTFSPALWVSLIFALLCISMQMNPVFAATQKSAADTAIGKKCVACHSTNNPGLVSEWKKSAHHGKDVDCYDCHKSKEGDKGAFMHNKVLIHTIVTPKDCQSCHANEVAQQQRSHHAKAGQILASLDNLMGEVIGGPAAVNAGCRQCHGSNVELDAQGMPTAETWPNTGIGRLNPDGTRGSCSACHGRHRFSIAQARTPDTCGKCHVGPDHPQKEVYEESKHGIMYKAFEPEMNLELKKWVVGVDYSAAPTCTTCHMGATQNQAVTHDVGERISWTLRPPISSKINLVRLENGDEFDVPEGKPIPKVGEEVKGSKVASILTWDQRRDLMKDVCAACHTDRQIDGHYKQFDAVVDLYNDKFARPIAAMMGELVKGGYISPAPFDDKIEWTWWEIWHHEGRRARHGVSMMAPDYTHWHGLYEVGKHWYTKFIPELREIATRALADPALVEGGKKLQAALDELLARPEHAWFTGNLPPAEQARRKQQQAEFDQRYKR